MGDQFHSQDGPSPEGGGPPSRDGAGASRDVTVDFSAPERAPGGPGGDLAFLEPPRGGDELGWLAQYRVRRLIGSGGMGLVYLAEDSHLGRAVALKIIRPDLAKSPQALARFAREARAAASLDHDHVVRIYQVGEARGVAFFSMEYLRGVSLQDWLDRGRRPSVALVLRVGREVAAGLMAAHAMGLIHRDIKPGNLWLESPNARVKILDFGHARAEAEGVLITQAGAIVGTPAYMSPEQAAGEPTGPASDLFSLGCVLYRLACNRLPFPGDTILGVLNALATRPVTPPLELNPELPEALAGLISRLLAKPLGDRPGSAREVFEAIREIERGLASGKIDPTPAAHEVPNLPPAPPAARRSRSRLAKALVLTLLLALGSSIFLARIGPGRPPTPTTIARTGDVPPAPPAAVFVRAVEAAPPGPGSLGEMVPTSPPAPESAEALGPSPPAGSTARLDPARGVDDPGQVPAEVASPSATWGVLVDPDGDCRLVLDEARQVATLEVPGKPHVLSAEIGKRNAPRLLRRIQGDFDARVRVDGTELVGGKPTSKTYTAYHGGGIVLWQDADNYVRLEIATDLFHGKPRHYANFEYRRGAKLVATNGLPTNSGSAQLRMERRRDRITASFGADGRNWTSFDVLQVTLAEELEVGLAAINTASRPLAVRFEDYQVQPVAAKAP